MTLTLSFPPDVEARLRERAAASGKDVEAIVREAIEATLADPAQQPAPPHTHEQWSAALRAWAAGHRIQPGFVDDSRQSIYAGRGE